MRICKCGGKITQHELTGNREAWNCRGCGRYEAINRVVDESNQIDIINTSSAGTQDKYEATFSCVTPKKD